jgi:hypothetical protein
MPTNAESRWMTITIRLRLSLCFQDSPTTSPSSAFPLSTPLLSTPSAAHGVALSTLLPSPLSSLYTFFYRLLLLQRPPSPNSTSVPSIPSHPLGIPSLRHRLIHRSVSSSTTHLSYPAAFPFNRFPSPATSSSSPPPPTTSPPHSLAL